jgi:hypothetical protein
MTDLNHVGFVTFNGKILQSLGVVGRVGNSRLHFLDPERYEVAEWRHEVAEWRHAASII